MYLNESFIPLMYKRLKYTQTLYQIFPKPQEIALCIRVTVLTICQCLLIGLKRLLLVWVEVVLHTSLWTVIRMLNHCYNTGG
jgi:hypothetical protein